MPEKKEGPMQDMIDRGNLSLQVTSTIGLLPVENARISISYTGEDSVVEEITTDNSGRTEAVSRRWNGVWMQSRQTALMQN